VTAAPPKGADTPHRPAPFDPETADSFRPSRQLVQTFLEPYSPANCQVSVDAADPDQQLGVSDGPLDGGRALAAS